MRSRNLKPGLYKNEELAELPPTARLLFTGLWCMADRAGRLEDRPKRIKAEILPYDDLDVDELLALLHGAGFILRYEIRGARYIQVVNFAKHQSPHKNEADSVIPAPDDSGTSTVQAPEPHASTRADSLFSDSLTADTSIPDTLTEDCGSQNHAPARAGQPAPPISEPNEPQESPYVVFAAYLEEIGADEAELAPAFKRKQLGVAKRLLEQGFGEGKVRRYLRFLQLQEWRDGPIDLFTVERGIGAWEANGSPERPKARASPNGHGNGHGKIDGDTLIARVMARQMGTNA